MAKAGANAARKEETALEKLPEGAVPMLADDLFEDSGQGYDKARAEDVALPFLRIIQGLSPQIEKGNAKFIPGAQASMIFNTVSQQLYDGDDGLLVIPCEFRPILVEWTPRDSGGGFVGVYDVTDPIRKTAVRAKEGGKLVLPDSGNYLAETAQHYVLVLDEETGIPSRALISMASTQLKKSRGWMTTQMESKLVTSDKRIFAAPSFAFTYRLTTGPEKNAKGTFYNWQITQDRRTTADEVAVSKQFIASLAAGEIKTDVVDTDAASGAETGNQSHDTF